MRPNNQPLSLLTMLTWLTLLAFSAQLSLFILHYQTSDLLDSLVKSTLATQLWHSSILLPILSFIFIQVASLALFIGWIWFISKSCAELLRLSKSTSYWLGIITWLLACCAIITFNNLYFTHSFFSELIRTSGWYDHFYFKILFMTSLFILVLITILAYIHYVWHRTHLLLGGFYLLLGMTSVFLYFYSPAAKLDSSTTTKPNIIIIGLDSLRPDFTSYFGNPTIHTPNIDSILKASMVYTEAYSPLARTFPAWITLLTGKYPKHSHARSNLADPALIVLNDTLAKRLQQNGYETIYGSDEKRFSNITKLYGFDRLIGPAIGVNDFLLGGLSDLPLTNLLINMPLGKWLFPFNYANRAAAITYAPSSFLEQIKIELANRQQKPLFLAIHLCTSHWPYTWAHDKQNDNALLAERYQASVEAVDSQLGELLALLENNQLLKNTILILVSDHGTALALKGDRNIQEKNYQGNHEYLKWIPVYQIEARDTALQTKNSFSLDTSIGQGTDVLSMKQHKILLAFKKYGMPNEIKESKVKTSLIDIAPTILDMIHLQPLATIDGISLIALNSNALRPFFFETGYSFAEIEKTNISIANVVKHDINSYRINLHDTTLYLSHAAEKSINTDKQRAVLIGDWLLARMPARTLNHLAWNAQKKLTYQTKHIPAFFVLLNVKTGEWTIGLSSTLGKQAPLTELVKQFNQFNSDEIQI